MGELIAFLFVIAFVAIVILYDAMAWGFVLFKFYHWFVLPVVYFAPQMNYWQAIGLMFVIGLFKNQSIGELKEEYYKRSQGARLFGLLINPWVTLLMGWFVRAVLLT